MTQKRIVKGIVAILLMVFVFSSCFSVKKIPEIADYHILNSEISKDINKPKLAVFMFENKRLKNSFQKFLGLKLNMSNENRNFPVKIQNEKFVISIFDKMETEKLISFEDYIFKNSEKEILKEGSQKTYISISVADKVGNDCLKNNSIYQNLVVNYLKELKLEYSKF